MCFKSHDPSSTVVLTASVAQKFQLGAQLVGYREIMLAFKRRKLANLKGVPRLSEWSGRAHNFPTFRFS
jgi:hypothetical protein